MHYDNILLLDDKGRQSSTIDKKRRDFYLKNELVKKVEPQGRFTEVYQMLFTPEATNPRKSDIAYKENRCVVSGATENLTLHHVVPYCIRRYFPEKYKDRASHWCVLLTRDIHNEADQLAFELYEKERNEYFKEFASTFSDQIRTIKLYNSLNYENMPTEKQERLRKAFEEIDYSLDELQQFAEEELEQARREWAEQFIESRGGILAVHVIFKEAFLKLEPKYLPDGYLELDFD